MVRINPIMSNKSFLSSIQKKQKGGGGGVKERKNEGRAEKEKYPCSESNHRLLARKNLSIFIFPSGGTTFRGKCFGNQPSKAFKNHACKVA